MNFMQEATGSFKKNILKILSQVWKDWKHHEGITKQDFKNYYKQRTFTSRFDQRRNDDESINHQHSMTDQSH